MMPASGTTLSRIQTWMQAVIQHPGGIDSGIHDSSAQAQLAIQPAHLNHVILPSLRQTSAERLQIYADAYFARLLEVMKGEFPALLYALEEDLFAEFALGYLQAHPSQSYTLSDLGGNFPAHLEATRPSRESDEPDWADFLIDCSRLERTYAEVFDGPGPESLLPDSSGTPWQGLTPEQFPKSRLKIAPWVRLVALRFPAQEYISAIRRHESPSIPEPAETWLVVSRRDFVVRRVPVPHAEYEVLQSLRAGETVESALEPLWKSESSTETASRRVEQWFAAWTSAGYFQGFDLEDR